MRNHTYRLIVAGFAFAGLLAACGGQTAASPEPGAAGEYSVVIDPANFVEAVHNVYWPLVPGTTYVYEGDTEDGFEHVEVTVTGETREVMSVQATVVRDAVWVDGELAEDTYDWYAQDAEGNVWYFGEEVSNVVGGEVVNRHGSWEAGVDGALPGVVMWADPPLNEPYRQEYYPGQAEDMAEVLSLATPESVAYGSYANLLQTAEWNPLEPDVLEHKYYVPGVGLVLEVVVEGGSGRIELVDVRFAAP